MGILTRLVGVQESILIACDDVDALLGETLLKSRNDIANFMVSAAEREAEQNEEVSHDDDSGGSG